MAPRQDLVASAVGFLQDPSVASSPIDKKIEFLKSKNLTQEEIDLSLAQAAAAAISPASPNAPYYPPEAYQRPPPGYGYGYPPPGQWQQPPPEVPKRDWRDWFIMATVVGGAGYGLYMLAQRYVKPLIAPPTPPQLEQDKAAIDEQFNRAFTLLDTLTSDTTALKKAEEARTEKLDLAIADIESVIQDLKLSNQKREDDARRMEAEVKNMKDSLPRAMDSVREGSERQLKELSTELASLKLLMGNRMGNSGSNLYQNSTSALGNRPSTASTPQNEIAPGSKSNPAGINGTSVPSYPASSPSYSVPSSSIPAGNASARPNFTSSGNKASIPAWQMAAQNKGKEASVPANASVSTTNGTNSSSTLPQDGAEVVDILNAS